MDVLRVPVSTEIPSGYEIVINGGRTPMGLDAIQWAQRGEELGAGELVVNSIDAVEQKDLFTGLLKALIFGSVVGTVGCFYGMGVEGGAEGVGKATTKSVVTSLTSMLAMDALLTAIIYFIL